jgi:hypothetical protein
MQERGWQAELSRRDFLRLGLGAAALPLLARLDGLAMAAPAQTGAQAAATAAAPKITAKANSVIQIWLWGGPSHVDTFDPKPGPGRDYCGPLDSPIDTNVPGVQISQLLPRLAEQADKYSIIRGMTHGINGHETAAYRVQTGHEPGHGLVYPGIGAIAALFKGYDHGYKSSIPPYVVLTTPQGRFSESGFLGPKYRPFATGGDPNRDPFLVEGFVVQGISSERRERRRQLLASVDTLAHAAATVPIVAETNQADENAYALINSEELKVFDLTTEGDAMREQYGRNRFGQSCLMARRLVEIGVPYITINYGGWDTHKRHFETIGRMQPEMDRAMATLLVDLENRGLLESTIVWWGGEFGRTPRVQWEPPWNGGRNHFGPAFCTVLAGGGFKGGCVVGATNATGEQVAERPTYPEDALGSILMLLGIDPDAKMPNPEGIDVPVMAPPKGGRLTEIMV